MIISRDSLAVGNMQAIVHDRAIDANVGILDYPRDGKVMAINGINQ